MADGARGILVGARGEFAWMCARHWDSDAVFSSLLEIYTGDTPSADRQHRGMVTEPMTCPPNGFQTGDGLVRLEPGESLTTAWGARLARS